MSSPGASSGEELVYQRFMEYSGFGDKTKAGELDGAQYAKFCKECNLIGKTCTKTDVDLIFTKCKPKGGRKLDVTAFKASLVYIAEKRFPKTWKENGKQAAVDKVYELVGKSEGPVANATKADYVKFHDDKSTYTGVYAKGGPTNVDNKITLSSLADRSPANARGMKK